VKPKRLVPTQISYRSQSRILEIAFGDDERYELSAEFLRVYSPSAEVRGHGPGQDVLQVGKEDVAIERIEPVGNYAVRLYFDDGHDTGIYSWEELRRLGERADELWRSYLARLEAAGHQRRTRQSDSTSDFGFERVPVEEKAQRVATVFTSVAERYDLMNDLMSFGVHRLWKRFAVAVSGVREGQRVLDLASGSGDMARHFAKRVGPHGSVILSDVNASMLELGRRRMVDAGIVGGVRYVRVDAESLPFPDDSFDLVSIAFGLRNVTRKGRALAEMYRVLAPGGRVLVLEFSKVTVASLDPIYRAYSLKVLPMLGKIVADDPASYRYLAESIRVHPDQEELLEMMIAAGFERCDYHNLSAGIVAVHRGFKL